MTIKEAQRRVAKGFGWWEGEWCEPRSANGVLHTRTVYCARLKDGTTMRVRWP